MAHLGFFFQQHSHLFEFGVLISPKLGCSFLYADHLLHLTHCLSGTTSNHLVLLERRDDGGSLLLCRDLHLITQDYMMVPTTECSVGTTGFGFIEMIALNLN